LSDLWFDRLTTNGNRLTTNGDRLTTNGNRFTTTDRDEPTLVATPVRPEPVEGQQVRKRST